MAITKQQRIKEAIRPIVSEKLKSYRQTAELTQEQMAQRYGMSVRSYVDLEHGICFPSAITLTQLLTSLSREELKVLLADIKEVADPLHNANSNSID